MKRSTTLKMLVLSALMSVGFLVAFFGGGILSSSPALAQDGGKGNCLGGDATKTPDDPGDTVILTAPAGQVITTVAIKAGTPCFTFTEDGSVPGCYTVEGIGTSSVTVTRIGSGPDCKEISHVEFLTSTGPPPPTTTTTTTTG